MLHRSLWPVKMKAGRTEIELYRKDDGQAASP